MKSYVTWNNKGGIGKTMLTFLLSTEYALQHPNENVVVIDMCPQANVSQVLLGGTNNIDAFTTVIESKVSIADYFISRYSKAPYQMTGNEGSFPITPNKYNSKLPDNVYLVTGSNKLELMTSVIDKTSSNSGVGGVNEWKCVYNWINDLKNGIKNKIGDNTTFFIDTNPSFANYTKMALLSADRLIIPCFADVGSFLALNNLMYFLYDIKEDTDTSLNNLNNVFYNLSKVNEMIIPLIHMVVVGRSTQYDQRAATAFKHIEEKINKKMNELQKKYNGNVFSNSGFPITQKLRDLNSIAPLINVEGEMISRLVGGQKTGIISEIGTEMQIPTNINEYKNAVNDLVKFL